VTFLVGIDSGWSKTAALLCDGEGRVLARYRGAGCALSAAPSVAQAQFMNGIATELCSKAGVKAEQVAGWGAGLNGVDFADEFAVQHAGVAAAIGIDRRQLHLVNDGVAALWGATDSPAAVLVQHGSGLTSAWRTQHGDETIFDHLDVARVYDMRKELIVTVARMIDGRETPTTLVDRVMKLFDVRNANDFAEQVYRGRIPPMRLRETPPLIYAAWSAGDAAATRLVEAAIADYAVLTAAIARRVGAARFDLVFGGGVLQFAPERFWNDLAARLSERVPQGVMRQAAMTPEFGAAVMAGFHSGVDPRRLFNDLAKHIASEPAPSAGNGRQSHS